MKDNKETAWWLPPSDPYDERFKRQREVKQENSQTEIFKVNYCPQCETAYQYSRDGSNVSKYFYFEDFPTYGLKRRNCGKCK